MHHIRAQSSHSSAVKKIWNQTIADGHRNPEKKTQNVN